MSGIETRKLDELLRKLPENSGLDPRLIEAAKTELDLLRFRACAGIQSQKVVTTGDVAVLKEQLREKETEILVLKQLLRDRSMLHSVERYSDSHHVAKIKTKFKRLYDMEWVDAYQFFTKKDWKDIEIVVTLQRILRASYAFCSDVAKEQLDNIKGEAIFPSASWMDDEGIITRTKKQGQISREIRELAKTYQRSTSRECLKALQKTFISTVLPTFIDPSQYADESVTQFASLCVDVTWAMCVQEPPMVFIDKLDRGSSFNSDMFQKYINTGSDKYDYLVWPALLLYQDGPLLVKGIAQPINIDRHEVSPGIKPVPSVASVNSMRHTPGRVDEMDTRADDDHDSWERASKQGQTPPVLVRRDMPNETAVAPRSPYFAPYSVRTPKSAPRGVPDIVVDQHDDLRSRHSRTQDIGQGNLTVAWKQSRLTSAP
ncbi:uncharacterized protein LOC127841762 [Dreissena polymorpha]|uniref:Mitochondria-eating protein C-terminal domain-containing protein n=1 Tax=Dreissena polymorpha TaxID=45954 RepID=A0A9D4IU59_DREPO|nr:uncharacterized protein LOC127841762 [Dreissena polymorpha]KAH3785059.1 hypothetical protein DPMN_163142 [Dreissena polymorpha]